MKFLGKFLGFLVIISLILDFYNSLKIWILDYLIAFLMFIRKTIIPIRKCSIWNFYSYLRTTTFICNILSHPIKFFEKIEFLIFDACFKTKHELHIAGLRMICVSLFHFCVKIKQLCPCVCEGVSGFKYYWNNLTSFIGQGNEKKFSYRNWTLRGY